MKRFQKIAREKGLSMSKLAAKADINRTSLYLLAHDRIDYFPAWRVRLAAALEWEGDPQALVDEVGEDD